MPTKTYVYDDPTGAGDDAELTLPAWADPPSNIAVRDAEGNHLHFYYIDEVK